MIEETPAIQPNLKVRVSNREEAIAAQQIFCEMGILPCAANITNILGFQTKFVIYQRGLRCIVGAEGTHSDTWFDNWPADEITFDELQKLSTPK